MRTNAKTTDSKKMLTLALALSLGAVGMTAGCSTQPAPKDESAKKSLETESQSALSEMKRLDSGLENRMKSAYGYAIYPDASKAGLVVGGAFGRGEVYEQDKFIGYSTIQGGTIGLQIGAMNYSQLILFENRQALDKFTRGEWTPTANASAAILKAGAATSTPFKDGVSVFQHSRGGGMAEASIGGQKFSFEASAR